MMISPLSIANAQTSNPNLPTDHASGLGVLLRDTAVTGGAWIVKGSYKCSQTEYCSWLPSTIHAINSWIGETAAQICNPSPQCVAFTEFLGTASSNIRSWCYSTDLCYSAADGIHGIYHDALLRAVSDAYSPSREE